MHDPHLKSLTGILPTAWRRITSYEDACTILKIDPAKLPDVSNLSPEFSRSILAFAKLLVIYKAVNHPWAPRYGDPRQVKFLYTLNRGRFDLLKTRTFPNHGFLVSNEPEKALFLLENFMELHLDYWRISSNAYPL